MRGGFLYRGDRRHVVFGLQYEALIRDPERLEFVRSISEMGFNSTSITANGGDAVTIDWRKSDLVPIARQTVEEMNRRGIVPFVYAGEQEHGPGMPRQQTLSRWIEAADAIISTLDGLEYILVDSEENGWPLYERREFLEHVETVAPDILVATHQTIYPSHHVENWERAMPDLISDGLIDVVLCQGSTDEMPGLLKRWFAYGVAVVAHEEAPANDGTDPYDILGGLRFILANKPLSSGGSIYPGYIRGECTDLDCPNPEIYSELARAVLGNFPAILGRSAWGSDRNGDGVIDAGDLRLEILDGN